ncbi:zinc finger protein, putative [Hepatocystis sp. ex Piliocolobus tephrosceles]|nr:zinc finger protein, putative [Hepatocystis sp. ex Piliocolobus tephrosceles]
MDESSELSDIYNKNGHSEKEIKEELISVSQRFLEDEDEEGDYFKDIKKYLYNESSFVKRINTYNNVWLKKPAHLSSLILARNGFICINESVIKCEICGFEYSYGKGTYSMYTRITDLCLLHRNNCPWKQTLIDLSFFKLDEISLTRENLLTEYENNIFLLKKELTIIPLINIKKTISHIILILKKCLKNDSTKKKFDIFQSQLEYFKYHFVNIFIENQNVINKGIEYIKKDYNYLLNCIVDVKYIEDLMFDILDEQNFINILSDNIYSNLCFNTDQDDVNVYLKIVNNMRNYTYQHVNIYKTLALLGWVYKTEHSFTDKENGCNGVLICKYCYREVNLFDYSYFSLIDNKWHIFVQKKQTSQKKKKTIIKEVSSKMGVQINGVNDTSGTSYESSNDLGRNDQTKEEEGQTYGKKVGDFERLLELVSDRVSKANNELKEVDKDKNIEDVQDDTDERTKENEKKKYSFTMKLRNIFSSKGNNNKIKEDTVCDDSKHINGTVTDENDKHNIVDGVKKDGDVNTCISSDNRDTGGGNNTSEKNDTNRDSSTSYDSTGDKIDADRTNTSCENTNNSSTSDATDNMLNNLLLKSFLKICNYLDDENCFTETSNGYYMFKNYDLDKGVNKNEKNKNNNNYDDDSVNEKNEYIVHPFNTIENHRLYCPYMMNDLYSFSKITKLFFELLTSEFQRKYIYK